MGLGASSGVKAHSLGLRERGEGLGRAFVEALQTGDVTCVRFVDETSTNRTSLPPPRPGRYQLFGNIFIILSNN